MHTVSEEAEEEPYPSSSPTVASTPLRAGLGISHSLSPGQPLASSPLLKDAPPTPPPQQQQQQPTYLSPTPAAAAAAVVGGSSRASSIRLSRDSEDLRWHGVADEELYEEGALSAYGGREAEQADAHGDADGDGDGDVSVAESAYGDEGVDELQHSGATEAEAEAEAGTAAYSNLSKRADLILENAKRKLNLLEGNLKGARHSLAIPTLATIPSPTDVEFAAARQGGAGASYGDEERGGLKGPRINFRLPRRSLSTQIPNKPHSIHARGLSETAVQAGSRIPVRGLELPAGQDLGQRHPLLRGGGGGGGADSTLETVHEGNPSAAARSRFPIVPKGASGGDGRSALASTKDLRIQAEELRGRLSFIQEKVRDDSIKRRSLGWQSPGSEAEESVIYDQVKSVEQTLDQQDEVISQLELAEQYGDTPGDGMSRSDSRAEWQHVLDHAPAGDGSPNSSEGPNGIEEEEEDFVSVMEQPMQEDDQYNLEGRHEDRADAFDYEHFILHSGMGNFNNVMADARSDTSSSDSVSTTRGDAAPDEDRDARQQEAKHWDDMRLQGASVASFASYETAAEPTSSDSASDSSDLEGEEILASNGAWPMPPQRSPDGPLSPGQEVSTPVANAFAMNKERSSRAARPASMFLSALQRQRSSPNGQPSLTEEDQQRLYSLAECLQDISGRLQDPETDPFDRPVWRARLEEARRLLSADF